MLFSWTEGSFTGTDVVEGVERPTSALNGMSDVSTHKVVLAATPLPALSCGRVEPVAPHHVTRHVAARAAALPSSQARLRPADHLSCTGRRGVAHETNTSP